MADNTTLNAATGGDVIRDIDRGTSKTQVVALDGGGAFGESLISTANPLSVDSDSADELLKAILIELRVLTGMVAEAHFPRQQINLDHLRKDEELINLVFE